MKKLMTCVVLALVLSGCGFVEMWYDSSNYESITNERGTIELYSGGVVVKRYAAGGAATKPFSAEHFR